MLRLLSLSLLVSNLTGCYGFGTDGQICFTESECQVDESGPVEPSGPPPAPLSVMVEGVERSTVAVAQGGLLEVDVWGRTRELPSIAEDATAFDAVITSQSMQAPSRTRVQVVAGEAGEGVLHASISGFSTGLTVQVRELGTVGLSVDGEAPRAQLTVMPDIEHAALQLHSPDGEALFDHSIALDPSADPEFSLQWSEVRLPTTPGEHALVLTRATGELHAIDVRVVDHLDEIVVDQLDPAPQGRLCVHGELAGERVETRAWNVIGALTPTTHGCFTFAGLTSGSAIVIERAGLSKQVVIP